MEILLNYFPDLTALQIERFSRLFVLYKDWNQKINVVSRKDFEELYVRHVLHSLGIAKVVSFKPGTTILDVGTGGGFPGIPLAILFPECQFHLVDSIGKKIKVVEAVIDALELDNVKASNQRAESVKGNFDFIVSRAVTHMDQFVDWVKNKVSKKSNHPLKNGIIYLKGGDLKNELAPFPKATVFELKNYFEEDFFETKSVVHIPLKFKGKV
jgi:16S rRNA (guanine527-N7)-methyltransferase